MQLKLGECGTIPWVIPIKYFLLDSFLFELTGHYIAISDGQYGDPVS